MFLRNKVKDLGLTVSGLDQVHRYTENRVDLLLDKMRLLEEHLGIEFVRVEAHLKIQPRETSKLK